MHIPNLISWGRKALCLAGLGFLPLSAAAPQILVLLERGFNGDEFFGPTGAFQAAGYEIVVASRHEGVVPLRLDGEANPQWDVPVDLAMREVNPADFPFLFVPGGYSPGFLEKDPDAVRIVRHFLEAGKPVGMVCHGPRVLLSNGLLTGRTWTSLFTVADEVADPWVARPGRYLDLPVVVDDNLITARYPGDMAAFSRAFLQLLANEGGLPNPQRHGAVALILSNHAESWGNWHFFSRLMSAVNSFGLRSERAAANNAEWVDRVLADWQAAGEDGILAVDIHALDWSQTSPKLRELVLTHPRLVAGEGMKPLLADRELPFETLPERQILPWTRAILAQAALSEAAFTLPEMPPPATLPEVTLAASPEAARVIFALREGFDDESLAAWVTAATAHGLTPVLFTAPEAGRVTGMNGLAVEIALSTAEVQPAEGQWVVAPGFFWPQLNPRARQAEQPPWVTEADAVQQAHDAWLLAAREQGAQLALTGLDALRIGRSSDFDGISFAASTQNRWSFGRGAARFSDAAFEHSAERLVTVRDAGAVAELFAGDGLPAPAETPEP